MGNKQKETQRYKYNKEALKAAMEAVQAGMSVSVTSQKFHVSKSTLHIRKRANCVDLRPRPDTVLSKFEEDKLVCWIYDCSERGLFVSKQHLLNSVALLMFILNRHNPFANGKPGRHWYQGFLKRHRNIAEKLSSNSMMTRSSITEDGLMNWFNNTKLRLKKKRLLDISPFRVFSMDSLLLINPEANDDIKSIYVHIACNAAGQLAPQTILLKWEKISNKILDKIPHGWKYAKSENGLMNSQLFFEYITKTFYTWLCNNKIEFPIVLFMDGKIPYVTLALTEFCSKNNIELIALHSNASSILQPLEISLFPEMKYAWNTVLQSIKSQNRVLSCEDIVLYLKNINQLDVMQLLRNGFEQSGVYPLSNKNCNYQKLFKNIIGKDIRRPIEFMLYEPNITINCIEKMIGENKLSSFKNIGDINIWSGRVEDTSLFLLWRKLINLCKIVKTNEKSFETM